MPLLFAYRRWWSLFFVGVLFLPMMGHVLPDLPGPVRPSVAPAENWWVRAGDRLDPYINAHFGFRGAIMAANAAYARAFRSTRSRPLAIGHNGQLYYTGDKALEQSLGLVTRPQELKQLANVIQRVDTALKERGGKLIFASPPNNTTVLTDNLPNWAKAQMRNRTELDILHDELRARGITFVDLRPLLKDHLKDGPLYLRSDSHWNQRGAVLSFNAAMEAAGRPDLVVPLNEAIGPLQPHPTGDLARYLGEANQTGDRDYAVLYPQPHAKLTPILGVMPVRPPSDPFQAYAFSTGHPGPSIMVIGDSFTQSFWERLVQAKASRYAWMHNNACKFDWKAVMDFKPDILIYAPVERSIPCRGEPAGMPPG